MDRLDWHNRDCVTCPHCAHPHYELTDFTHSGEWFCDVCDRSFHLEIERDVIYITSPVREVRR